jgi:uncharacterized protein YnzC (UPF0291/DUF896 family)
VDGEEKSRLITEEMIARINELARKKKTVGLSDEESAEQRVLREAYLKAFRESLRAQLDQIKFVEDLPEGEGDR